MIITKKHLSRRTFLRGTLGAGVALPFLDAMVPALAAAASAAPFRFGVVYMPCGVYPDTWHPEKTGSDFEFKPVMQPLAAASRSAGDHQQAEGAVGGVGACRREFRVPQRHRSGGGAWGDGRFVQPSPVEEDARPVHCRSRGGRYTAALDRGWHRGHGNRGRGLRRLPLRPLRNAGLARRNEPAAGVDQSARHLRADVWRDGHAGAARRAVEREAEPARLGDAGDGEAAADAWRARSGACSTSI